MADWGIANCGWRIADWGIADWGIANCELGNCGLRIGEWRMADGELRIRGGTLDRKDLEKRTKNFSLRLIGFVANLPKNKVTDVLSYQVLKSGTSIGANYREANRAESHDDFIHKIAIVEKEASESQYWLELFKDANIGNQTERDWLLQECSELLAVFTAMGKTAKARRAAKRAASRF